MGYSGIAFTVSVWDLRRSYLLTTTSMRNAGFCAHESSSATSLCQNPPISPGG